MKNLHKLRKLLESQVEEAESIIAARGFSQELQDMIQKLGRLLNEDLPAVSDQMRHSLGPDIATAFEDQTTQVLQSVMDNLRTGKQDIDNSVAKISMGEMPASDLETSSFNDMDLDSEEPELDLDLDSEEPELDLDSEEPDQFAGDEVAAGGDEPLGRARKESLQRMEKKLAEARRLLDKAKKKVKVPEGFTKGMTPEFEVDGWKYFVEYQDDDDVRKIMHYTVSPEGKEEGIDFTPYSQMSKKVFGLWLKAGRPSRKDFDQRGPLRSSDFE